MAEIRFPAPAGTVSRAALTGHCNANIGDLYPALDMRPDNGDERAVTDEVVVTWVDLEPDQVEVTYEVRYSAYHGCSDRNYAVADERSIVGLVEGTNWIFEKFVPPEPRSTVDEF